MGICHKSWVLIFTMNVQSSRKCKKKSHVVVVTLSWDKEMMLWGTSGLCKWDCYCCRICKCLWETEATSGSCRVALHSVLLFLCSNVLRCMFASLVSCMFLGLIFPLRCTDPVLPIPPESKIATGRDWDGSFRLWLKSKPAVWWCGKRARLLLTRCLIARCQSLQ